MKVVTIHIIINKPITHEQMSEFTAQPQSRYAVDALWFVTKKVRDLLHWGIFLRDNKHKQLVCMGYLQE